nr:ovomucoid isoform X1 [Equus caballus]XP_008521548.1 PREDICTED: double-headed protease inhibitor, submandibular gland-like [Equus przewalskii]XP_014708162.1 ovomucoid-like isoform X1 [Equus asinus]
MEKMKTFFVVILATDYFLHISGNNPYADITCGYYRRKSAQENRICSLTVYPLCASNNVTYSNACMFCFANIAMHLSLKIRYDGKCGKAKSPEQNLIFLPSS